MTAFADALDLRTAVIEAVADASVADVWPRLVSLAESRLNRELRSRHQLAAATVTVATTGEIPYPADYVELSSLRRGQDRYFLNPARPLPVGVYDLEYYAKLPTLANGLTASNWLLDLYPDVYLYAVAEQAARHLRDAELAAMMSSAKDEALRSLYADDARARFGHSVVRVAGPTP